MAGADARRRGGDQGGLRRAGGGGRRFTVAALDLGIKAMTPELMAQRGIEVHVLPATASVEQVREVRPDGVFFSNGPGDPATADHEVELLKAFLGEGIPLLRHLLRKPDLRPGAGLRHLQAQVRPPRHQPAGDGPHDRQGRGHRAQPRLRRRCPPRRRHRDALRIGSGQPRLPQSRRRRTTRTANSRGLELTAFSVQYHPEAAAGPHDAAYLFDRFVSLLEGSK
jgi:carbamoyl-phosphate synthase small subunit